MTYIVIYLVVSLVVTVFLWAMLALAKRTDDEKEKNLTGIIFKLASTHVTNKRYVPQGKPQTPSVASGGVSGPSRNKNQ